MTAIQGDEWVPGKCQVCKGFHLVHQVWPSTAVGQYVELCEDCSMLSSMEIAARVKPQAAETGPAWTVHRIVAVAIALGSLAFLIWVYGSDIMAAFR